MKSEIDVHISTRVYASDLLQVLSQERITTAHEGLESDGFAKHVHILVQKYALIVLQLVKVIEKLHRILA